jgi:hypothetical protein
MLGLNYLLHLMPDSQRWLVQVHIVLAGIPRMEPSANTLRHRYRRCPDTPLAVDPNHPASRLVGQQALLLVARHGKIFLLLEI